MHAGRLSVKVHGASLAGAGAGGPNLQGRQLHCTAHIEDYGKLCTRSSAAPGEGQQRVEWDEDLTFELGPGPGGGTLQLCVVQEGPGGDELVGMGSLCLEGVAEEVKRAVVVPLVGEAPPGRHVGEVSATLRFFPSRSPGKARDVLGREVIDPMMLGKGPKEAAREANERSPCSSPRRRTSREERKSAEPPSAVALDAPSQQAMGAAQSAPQTAAASAPVGA